MTILGNIAWLNCPTTTSVAIGVRTGTTGIISATISGQEQSATVASISADDVTTPYGCVNLIFTGLPPNTEFGQTEILLDDIAIYTVYPRTLPSSSGSVFNVMYGSCWTPTSDWDGTKYLVNTYNPVLMAALGDNSYSNDPAGNWIGETLSGVWASPYDNELMFKHRLDWSYVSGVKHICDRTGIVRMDDDHELAGDNWDHTVVSANYGSTDWAVDKDDVEAHWDVCSLVTNTMNPIPANDDVEAAAETPPEAQVGRTGANYPVRYFRQTAGSCEFFFLDTISYKGVPQTEAPYQTLIGANQKAWLKAHLKSSTAVFKVIVSPKKTLPHTGFENPDGWNGYITELEELLAYIHAGTDWVVPGGVSWVSGDMHQVEVVAADTDLGHTWDHLCVNPSPTATGKNTVDGTAGIYSRLIYPGGRMYQVTGIIKVHGSEYLEHVIVNNDNRIVWSGRVLPGSNKLHYLPQKVSF